MNPKQLREIRDRLIHTYAETGMWGVTNPAWGLPEGVKRGSEVHLAFLTLVYTISGGREPVQLWNAARQTFAEDAELFDLRFLAYANPATLTDRLHIHGVTKKKTSEATVWQRIGQAIVMRADGSVKGLLANYAYDGKKLMEMLANSKTTFPVLSGKQTAPRWLYGLTAVGLQPLIHVEKLPVPLSPQAKRVLDGLAIQTGQLSALAFDPVDALGRYGCSQRERGQTACPAAAQCPIARFCRYGKMGTINH